MPNQQTHIRVVREWCQSLGVLTAVSISRAEAEMRLGAYVPMLVRDFPDAAFTTDSLNAVARQCVEGFPPYPVLAARLAQWWKPRMAPLVPALPPPAPAAPRPPPTPEEVAHVEALVREVTVHLRASAEVTEARSRQLEEAGGHVPQPCYLSPGVLDQLNPLPNGRKRA